MEAGALIVIPVSYTHLDVYKRQVYANEVPDRVVPLDILREFEKEGKIGKVYKYFYTTTGTGTSVALSLIHIC